MRQVESAMPFHYSAIPAISGFQWEGVWTRQWENQEVEMAQITTPDEEATASSTNAFRASRLCIGRIFVIEGKDGRQYAHISTFHY